MIVGRIEDAPEMLVLDGKKLSTVFQQLLIWAQMIQGTLKADQE